MADTITAAREYQIGQESTAGTAVAATAKLAIQEGSSSVRSRAGTPGRGGRAGPV